MQSGIKLFSNIKLINNLDLSSSEDHLNLNIKQGAGNLQEFKTNHETDFYQQ